MIFEVACGVDPATEKLNGEHWAAVAAFGDALDGPATARLFVNPGPCAPCGLFSTQSGPWNVRRKGLVGDRTRPNPVRRRPTERATRCVRVGQKSTNSAGRPADSSMAVLKVQRPFAARLRRRRQSQECHAGIPGASQPTASNLFDSASWTRPGGASEHSTIF